MAVPLAPQYTPSYSLGARAPRAPCRLRPCLQYDYICTYCTSVRCTDCTVNSLSTVCTEYIELCSVHTFIYIYYIVLFGNIRLCTVLLCT